MNLYRYDVTIHIDSEVETGSGTQPAITHVPNQRITGEGAALEALVQDNRTIYLNLADPLLYDVVVHHHEADLQGYFDSLAVSAADYANTPKRNDFDFNDVKGQLKAVLPDYMVPDFFVATDEFPLTGNGKIDRRALSEQDLAVSSEDYSAPTNALEQALCRIWQRVLGVPRVGIDDNYFSLGGNSINAIRVCGAVHQELDRDLRLATLFEQQTIRALAQMLGEIAVQIEAYHNPYPPLSFAQQRLFFIEQFEQGSWAYHTPVLMKLKSADDGPRLHKIINQLVARHPVLRTIYADSPEGKLYQQVLEVSLLMIPRNVDDEAALKGAVQQDIHQQFELDKAPGVALYSYRFGQTQYLLLLFHHIVIDGWSLEVLFSEMLHLYRSGLALEPIPVSYGDYAQWQRQYLTGDVLQSQLDFWRQQLDGFEGLALPCDKVRPPRFDYTGAQLPFIIDPALSDALRSLAKQQQSSLYSLLLSGYFATLALFCDQQDIVIGTPSDNRHHAQTQQLVGFFVNSLALRTAVTPGHTLRQLADEVHRMVLRAKAHQDLPFEKLVQMLDIAPDPGRHPVFQVMFSLQAFGEQAELPCELVDLGVYTPAKFDICLMLSDATEQIRGHFDYAVSLFERSTIAAMADMYLAVLKAMVEVPDAKVSSIRFSGFDVNPVQLPAMPNQSIQQCFETQVQVTPDSTAVVWDDGEMTYRQLNEKANALAHGIGSGGMVALYIDRSVDAVIAILAVLKAGAAYVPISPQHPGERVRFILQDCQARLVISQPHHCARLSTLTELPVITASDVADTAIDNPEPLAGPSDLAYVIYTSGTSGQPKGVMVEQGSVLNLIAGQQKAFDFDADERVLWLAAYIFDASVEQLFLALLGGAELHIVEADKVVANGITHLHATPGHLLAMGSFGHEHQLKRVISGGDVCPAGLAVRWGDLLINEYGPTETTVTTTQSLNFAKQAVPNCIGTPIEGTVAYVLSSGGQLLPHGAVGELYIGGLGVARGYLNRPQLNRESFIDNPFGPGRLYKTGDRARWLPGGNLQYLGRRDSQVKVRGMRIEVAEIEQALLALPQVEQAVVVAHKVQLDERLLAYVVADGFDAQQLQQALATQLPQYMVPDWFIELDCIPLTLNGKLDKKALPEPEITTTAQAAVNPLQQQLCEIWQSVLGLDCVGIHDNFFQLGGNSISAIHLTRTIEQVLGYPVPLAVLFEQATVAQLAAGLGHGETMVIPALAQGHYPLSFAQQRLLFIEQYEGGTDVYHMPYLFELTADADLQALTEAFNQLAERHEMMRNGPYRPAVPKSDPLAVPIDRSGLHDAVGCRHSQTF